VSSTYFAAVASRSSTQCMPLKATYPPVRCISMSMRSAPSRRWCEAIAAAVGFGGGIYAVTPELEIISIGAVEMIPVARAVASAGKDRSAQTG